MILLEFDKAGAEWVVVAYLTGDARMLDVVKSGRSPHAVTGSLISGAPEELVLAEYKVVGKNSDPDEISRLRKGLPQLWDDKGKAVCFLPRSMSVYQAGKKSNHGLNYAMRYRRFALENEIEEAEAKVMVDAYNTKAYPGIPLWHEGIRRELKENGRVLTNCFGRKVRLLDEWGDELFNAAYSFKPQSTIGDMVNRALKLAYDDDTTAFVTADLLLQTHDSVTYQYPTDDWLLMAEFCVKLGLGYMSPEIEYNWTQFTIGTDLKVGKYMGEEDMVPIKLMNDTYRLAQQLEEAWEKLHNVRA